MTAIQQSCFRCGKPLRSVWADFTSSPPNPWYWQLKDPFGKSDEMVAVCEKCAQVPMTHGIETTKPTLPWSEIATWLDLAFHEIGYSSGPYAGQAFLILALRDAARKMAKEEENEKDS